MTHAPPDSAHTNEVKALIIEVFYKKSACLGNGVRAKFRNLRLRVGYLALRFAASAKSEVQSIFSGNED